MLTYRLKTLCLWLMCLYPNCTVLLPVVPRVSALAGCDRFGIGNTGFSTKTIHYNQNFQNGFPMK